MHPLWTTRLRFHIALNFREAKQYWGLEDFMNVTPTGVTNAAHLSLFLVNVAYQLRTDVWQRAPDYSGLDLKADCRGYTYVEETIKMLPEKPEPVFLTKILNWLSAWAVFMPLNLPSLVRNWRRYCYITCVFRECPQVLIHR